MADEENKLGKIRAKLKPNLALKVSERKKLPEDDLKRYDKLTAILAKLNAGEKVHNSDLKRWLKDDYANIAEFWQSEKETRADFTNVPEELRVYEKMVKKGIFYASRSNTSSCKGNHQLAESLHHRSEAAFEKAIERLQELLAEDAGYQQYLDRSVSFHAGSNIGINPIDIPRLITSRSLDRQGNGLDGHKRTKTDIKIDVIETVLADIAQSTRKIDVQKKSGHSDKLKKLLDNTGLDDELF